MFERGGVLQHVRVTQYYARLFLSLKILATTMGGGGGGGRWSGKLEQVLRDDSRDGV